MHTLYTLSGIAPSKIRRYVQADWEWTKMINDTQYIMHRIQDGTYWLKSWNSFMKKTKYMTKNPKEERIERWREKIGDESA